MTNRETMELFIEKNGQETVAYPFVEKDHVVFGNGMGIEEVIEQDISMPTVTHEEVSFKVGVGDQDVSSSVVDSSVGEMVIKGQTYHNILPEPSTHVLTNNKEMFKVNEGLDPNVEIVDGVSKSAILKGHTLVNLLTYFMPNVDYIDGQYRIRFSNVDNFDKITIVNKNSKTIKFSYFSNGWQEYEIPAFNNVLVEIPKETNEYNIFALDTFGWDSTNYREAIDNIVLLHGDYANQDIPYFEGMQSVKVPVLTTTGKNLININDGYLQNTPASLVSVKNDVVIITGDGSYRRYIIPIKLEKNKTYSFFGMINGGGSLRIRTLPDGGGETVAESNKTFIMSKESGTYYVALNTGTYLGDVTYSNIQLEESPTATAYEPFKTNILTVNEEVELRGIGDVRDELDLLTGEVTERIGEVVLDGSEDWWHYKNVETMENTFCLSNAIVSNILGNGVVISNSYSNRWWHEMVSINPDKTIGNANNKAVYIIDKSCSTLEEFTNYLQQRYINGNPVIIQYPLSEKSIKTVDLSSSGNWEKVVLDGSEDEVWHNGDPSWANKIFRLDGVRHTPNIMNSANALVKTGLLFSSHFEEKEMNNLCNLKPQPEGVSIYGDSIFVGSPQISTIGELRTWLSQNPITVWYQTTTHQDSTQVKQPIFFKDGHVQLSSGVDNSLIPTLDYQAKTSNSYVMDLMKANTRYTMKAKSASGTFTIDGTSYGAGTNGTFTTPSSMTNKLLVMSNKTNEEVMILEGDVTDKTIPYFKGIKSAFEGEDKIEVLSTGKNWVNLDNARLNSNHQKVVTRIENGFNIKFTYKGEDFAGWDNAIKIKVNVKRNTDYTVSLTKIVRKDPYGGMSPQPTWVTGYTWVRKGDSSNESFTERNLLDGVPTTMKFNSRDYDYVTLDICSTPSTPVQDGDFDIVDIQIEESSSATVYESYKSNCTKIPLLSPLRSLPNGVCDELIIDRMKKKATLIQRVYEIVLNDKHLGTGNNPDGNLTFMGRWYFDRLGIPRTVYNGTGCINANKMPIIPYGNNIWVGDSEGITIQDYQNQIIDIRVSKSKLSQPNHNGLLKWANDNPIIFQYELETPIITEIDLENFPFVYKNGHIFLNSEIAPTTQITYSISQQHQIDASTQDLIRHEQEIDYLYKLIAQYIQVDYQSTLLSLDLKLK